MLFVAIKLFRTPPSSAAFTFGIDAARTVVTRTYEGLDTIMPVGEVNMQVLAVTPNYLVRAMMPHTCTVASPPVDM